MVIPLFCPSQKNKNTVLNLDLIKKQQKNNNIVDPHKIERLPFPPY
jgi:hypothetical protein